jgi:DNA polymerase-1
MMPYIGSGAAAMEIDIAGLLAGVTDTGFTFDIAGGQRLALDLEEQGRVLADDIQRLLPPKRIETIFIPKRNNKTKGYVAGEPVIRVSHEPFNPNSNLQIIDRVFVANGYVPKVFTESGAPSTKAEVLASLPYPEAQVISACKVADKIHTMLVGEKGWLSIVGEDGRIRTSYSTLGTVTGRCSHSPNIAQVPKVRRDINKQILYGAAGRFGFECRSLFIAPPGWHLVGIDQSGLQLRVLAHYLAAWDNGTYALIVCDEDPHAANAAALGTTTTREQAKTFVYAMIYGGGSHKLGSIIQPDEDDEFTVCWIGQVAKDQLINGITGFKDLFRWLDSTNGDYIQGLDGRMLYVRKAYARLNTLLQAGGAILCKRWVLLVDAMLREIGLDPVADYQIVAFVHDELCIAARTLEISEIIAEVGVRMCAEAGRFYNLQCPLTGEAKIGRTWAEIH